jgi:hypothetical protein
MTVSTVGLVVLAAVALGLSVVGGPEAGRRDRRDASRLAVIRQIADALSCHAQAKAEPAAPAKLAEISPTCLAGDLSGLADPSTGAAYRIERPEPDLARVCADFERAEAANARDGGWPTFDPTTGCVSVSLTTQ